MDTTAITKGIDVYHGDGAIDWSAVLAAGIGFAFCKATEGTAGTDPAFDANWRGMGAVGITRGAYHFLHPGDDAHIQATHFLAVVGRSGGFLATDLPPVLDLEMHDGQPTARIVAAAHAWLETVTTATGKVPIVYTSPGFAGEFLDDSLGDYPLWIAHYTDRPAPIVPAGWADWTIWQYAAAEQGGHTVPGCPEPSVDINRFRGSHSDLVARFGLNGGVQ